MEGPTLIFCKLNFENIKIIVYIFKKFQNFGGHGPHPYTYLRPWVRAIEHVLYMKGPPGGGGSAPELSKFSLIILVYWNKMSYFALDTKDNELFYLLCCTWTTCLTFFQFTATFLHLILIDLHSYYNSYTNRSHLVMIK